MKILYQQWLENLSEANIKPMSDDTAAKILAIVYVYGGSMEFCFNAKLMADIQYVQGRAKLKGGEIPDSSIIYKMKYYVRKIEKFLSKRKESENSESPFAVEHPKWVESLMYERYGIKKMWI